MKGIRFNNLHTYDDLHMILTTKEIGSPAVKEQKIDIAGADGVLDMTDFFGDVNYDNVHHVFTFSVIGKASAFPPAFSAIKNALHGKKCRIVMDDDPAFYYIGRIHVGNFTNERNIGQIQIECDCEPWKYKRNETIVTYTIDGTKSFFLTNGRKRAVPVITASDTMTILYGGYSWTVDAGTYTITEMELKHGDNAVTVDGNGTITFKWQEGEL